MPDLVICSNIDCPLRQSCARYFEHVIVERGEWWDIRRWEPYISPAWPIGLLANDTVKCDGWIEREPREDGECGGWIPKETR